MTETPPEKTVPLRPAPSSSKPAPTTGDPVDPTLTLWPHVVSVIVGGVSGALASKLPWLPPDVANYVGLAAGSLLTTLTHFVMAKITESV